MSAQLSDQVMSQCVFAAHDALPGTYVRGVRNTRHAGTEPVISGLTVSETFEIGDLQGAGTGFAYAHLLLFPVDNLEGGPESGWFSEGLIPVPHGDTDVPAAYSNAPLNGLPSIALHSTANNLAMGITLSLSHDFFPDTDASLLSWASQWAAALRATLNDIQTSID